MENKPFIIEIEEAKTELVQCFNSILQKHGLNCYIMEPYFSELYTQVQSTARHELQQAKAEMEAAKAASDNTK